jgi:hypothetical protein
MHARTMWLLVLVAVAMVVVSGVVQPPAGAQNAPPIAPIELAPGVMAEIFAAAP